MDWSRYSGGVLDGLALTPGEAMDVLRSPDDELLAVLQAAFEVRRRHFGRDVNLHVLRNAKSGICGEDCAFCSQSVWAEAPVARYPLQSVEEIVQGAREAAGCGAVKYCIVTSSRAPTERDVEVMCEAARRIKKDLAVRVCASLGLLDAGQARRLAAAGVDRYNHNLETSRRFFPHICSTHTFDDRVATVRAAKSAGLEACCGGIIGLGESLEDRVDWAFTLRELDVDAIPVNFFNPRPGTRLAEARKPAPAECLRALAMVRLVNPDRDVRAAGGREACLGHLQPLALFAANSIFTRGYLTTGGQSDDADRAMIEEAGFEVGLIEA